MHRRTFLSAGTAAAATAALSAAAPASATTRAPRPGAADQRLLMGWFRDTYRSIEAMTTGLGLPADTIELDPAGRRPPRPSENTSPTNIGCGLWSAVAAHGLGLLSAGQLHARLDRTVGAVEGLHREHGFWLNWYDPHTGEVLTEWPGTGEPVRPFLSSVDNAWLVAGLRIAAHTDPLLRPRVERLLADADWSYFYTPYRADDPVGHPGQLRGGVWTDTEEPTAHHYGALNTEPRMASYLGIADGSLPGEHYWHLFRTLEPGNGQEQTPLGSWATVDGFPVWRGHYEHRGRKLVPTWGGSMFEALMVPLFVPEPQWSPDSWGLSHLHTVRSHIDHGLKEARYGYWGFSPCNVPEGGYQEYGVDAIGMNLDGYASNTDRTFTEEGAPPPPASAYTNGVVTPHASFLALPYAPSRVLDNLRGLARDFGAYRDGLGFRDSVNVRTGRVSDFMLALDQGMIIAALAQQLRPGLLQGPFRSGGFATRVKPLLRRERFGI
ncbi:glucoamylase family protein [Streptomyces sp. TP-A0874]|uniref:glucoamylase family protein n=1 Tax=Streptomyces sp. TP-A0874 TaxID=549819 RepID=UPI000852F3D2|nr:glucoamylase family protein [Streptomyces sp. TP-A0874]